MTPTERTLWSALRRSRADGFHFRRQQVIGDFIADFYCDAARLAIELDGAAHDLRGDYDERRDAELSALHVKVLHVPNGSIRENGDEVVRWIVEEANRRVGNMASDLTPGPFPKGKGRKSNL